MMMMVDGVILGQVSGLKCWRHLLIALDLAGLKLTVNR